MERTLGRATGIIRRVLDALLLALIVVVLGGVVLSKLVPLTGRQTIVIGGGSMEPAVPLGAAVIIKPVDNLSFYGVYSVAYLPASGDQFSALTPGTLILQPQKLDLRQSTQGRRISRS